MPSILTHIVRHALLGALLSSLVACGAETPVGPVVEVPVAVASVQLTAPRLTLIVGEQLQLDATPKSSGGMPLAGRVVTWESGTPQTATVTAAGLVTALRAGTVTVRATSEGIGSTIDLTIAVVPAASIAIDVEEFSRQEGESVQLSATVRSATGEVLHDRAVTWLSQNPAIATVDASGRVTLLREGSTRIIARHAGLISESAARVTLHFAADLVFDMYDGAPLLHPRLFTTDPRTPTATPAPVFAHDGTWDASHTPAATRLVFTCNSDGSAICSSNLDGSGFRVLTGGDRAYEDQPALSPDGTLIAYRRYPHGGTPGFANPTEIWVMNADGSNQRNVTNDGTSQSNPAWSPATFAGGMRIAFITDGMQDGYQVSHLQSMRADGSDRRDITPAGRNFEQEPSWSPDGSRIVFTRTSGELLADLMVVTVATGAVMPLLSSPLDGEQRGAAWSPDGQHVAFVSTHTPSNDGGYRAQVWTVRADGTGLSRRTDVGSDKANPNWLPRR